MINPFKSFSYRLFWLSVGILAIIGLTGLNVYLLYQLQSNSVVSIQQSKKIHIAEFADRTRHRIIHPFHEIGSINFKELAQTFIQTGQFTDPFITGVFEASKDSIYKDIYFIWAESKACYSDENVLKFNKREKKFIPTDTLSAVVCDGLGIARTRMRALVQSYQFNNKVLFDTHRSLTIALIDLKNHKVVGYLVTPIDQKYLINGYIKPKLAEAFGGNENKGLTVWLMYWTRQEILASSDPGVEFNYDKIQYVHQFPDFFDDWRLYAAMNEHLLLTSQTNSFVSNLIILGIAFIFLIGALVFMYITAKRERDLSARQSKFLANVTHELKTPLAVIQAAGENLSDGRIQSASRLKKYGSHIYSESLRLRHMIDKLLNVARADAGKSFVTPEPCDIDKLLEKYIDEHRQYFENKGVELNVSIAQYIPQIMLDEHSFHTILNNLISNAIKYSYDDKFLGIYLTYDQKNIILSVQDHGIGMEAKVMKHIFEKFYRGEDSLTARTKGYGLGLSFVRNLVNLNKGTINVESEKGSGTIFRVKFPAIVMAKEQEIEEPKLAITNK